ncbi:hypothetical protein FJZ22_02705 [Candidatus Pacearchaeota archaeon]|nr:hypothetical protein [Candidatus Pacearchaeota archaeon]
MVQKILVFDYDGTIVDSYAAYAERFMALREQYHLSKKIKDFKSLYSSNFSESLINQGLTPPLILALIRDIQKPFNGKPALITPFAGMVKLMNVLTTQSRVYVVTSNLTAVINESLSYWKIRGIQEVLGGDIEFSKVKKLKSIQKRHPHAEFLYIGDTVGDVHEAKEAGYTAVAVSWGYHSRTVLKKAKPDFIVDTPEALFQLLCSGL